MKAADFFKTSEGQKYVEAFQGSTVVLKYGGAALEEKSMMDYFLEDVAQMKKHKINIIIVHGGGKMLSVKMKERNLPVVFENGMRKTTAAAAELACEVFAELNSDICAKLAEFGVDARGFTDGRAVRAKLINAADPENRVGEVSGIHADLMNTPYIPVLSSIGRSIDREIPDGSLLNINADLLAMAVAESTRARKLVFISDVNGIYLDHTKADTKISHITESEIQVLIEQGVLHGGMQLKVEMALKALKSGVNKVHFIDGRIEHSLMYEMFTDRGIGTEIVHND